MLSRLLICTLIAIIGHSAQAQVADSTQGLFDEDWRVRNRCTETLLAAESPPIAALIEIAVHNTDGEYRRRRVSGGTQVHKGIHWRIKFAPWDIEYWRRRSRPNGASRRTSLIVEAKIRSFTPSVPWSTQQLAIWIVGTRGSKAQLTEVMRRVSSGGWRRSVVEVLACVWLERLPDQREELLPFLERLPSGTLVSQELARRRDVDRVWLCEILAEHRRALPAVLGIDHDFLKVHGPAREILAELYLDPNTREEHAGLLSLALRPGSAGLPVAISNALHSDQVEALERAISLLLWYEDLPEREFQRLAVLTTHENSYLASHACWSLGKAATTAARQRTAQAAILAALTSATDEALTGVALHSLRTCVAAQGAELVAALRPFLSTEEFAESAFGTLKARDQLSALQFEDIFAAATSFGALVDDSSFFFMRVGKRGVPPRRSSKSDALRELARRGKPAIPFLLANLEAKRSRRAFAQIPASELSRVRTWLDSPAWERQCAALYAMLGREAMSREDLHDELVVLKSKDRLHEKAWVLCGELLAMHWSGEEAAIEVLRKLLHDRDEGVRQRTTAAIRRSKHSSVLLAGLGLEEYEASSGRVPDRRLITLMEKGLAERADLVPILRLPGHASHRAVVAHFIPESPWSSDLKQAIDRLRTSPDRSDRYWLVSALAKAPLDSEEADAILSEFVHQYSRAWRVLAQRSAAVRAK